MYSSFEQRIKTAAGAGFLPERTGQPNRRMMMVSKNTAGIHEAVTLLMDDGFDVYLSQQLPSREQVTQLAIELLICDLSPQKAAAADAVAAAAQLLVDAGVQASRILFLVAEPTLADCLTAGISAEMLVWPGHAREALLHARRLMRSGASSEASLAQTSEARHVDSGGNAAAANGVRQFKDLDIDLGRMAVYRDNRQLRLTRTEYELLLVLLNADGSVLTRDAITERIWGCAMFGNSNTVDVHIKTLRKKLGDNAIFPKYVATVRGAGYRLADERPGQQPRYSAPASAVSV
ncbi:putative two component transcriptional regulator, winged helix family [Paenibacillus curdlanolyticus YK9]|uniref:Putative two component transcriptional regulator, winged helix family n=1 Tax=Paenibacillus curdlanolyticus YK9 TaxID=717606 RepID=E0IEV4_9BACL|nr:winged helix-turn-helix domain-containing protein [Paenibacillus curdlanolyticus]EFM09192.1 putative two component transcriptional regulator, winged helix family [Paenibacillus curdlanolyticus YK9]